MIKLTNILTEGVDDNYVHIGYGKYKEKGHEKDKNAPTFEKDDSGKYVPISAHAVAAKDAKGKKDTPKVNIFDKPSKKQSKSSSDMGVDSVVYNTRTKTVGIVRLGDERGETKTDADGNVNTSELEPYNPMKYPHQKDAKVAPSTKKEIDSRGLWKPFAQSKDTTSSEPNQAEKPKKDNGFQTPKRQGNPQINKDVKSFAEAEGFTPKALGNDEYKKKMMQAAVSALTDANFHQEARELVAKLEGKPEWAKKPEWPSPSDPNFEEKMKAIRTNSSEASEYMQPDGKTWAFGRDIAQKAQWGGVEAIDGIAFTLRMNGFHKEADAIQSIFDNKPYMKEGKLSLKSLIK